MTNYTKVDVCRICKNPELRPILDLGMHYSAGRFPYAHEPDPFQTPITLVRCDDEKNINACGLVQLLHNSNGDELYQHNYGYQSGLNATMTNHLTGIAREIEGRGVLIPGDLVLDIGSNDATLLKSFRPHIRKLGIDPTGNQFREHYTDGVKLVSDYFTKANFDRASTDKAKIISTVCVLYDLPDPNSFVRDVKAVLHPNGLWVFEQSYMPTMLKTKSIDTLCNEHVEYYSMKAINTLLNKNGMRVLDVSFNDSNGGSFRVTAGHKNGPHKPQPGILEDLLKQERDLGLATQAPYERFSVEAEATRTGINHFLQAEKAKGKTIYVLGASTKGNTLLQYCGLDNTIITAAMERNPAKFGRRTPGTNIPIISEQDARATHPDYFLVLPWHFRDEIIKREAQYLIDGGKLVFPLPEFQVVDKRALSSRNGQCAK